MKRGMPSLSWGASSDDVWVAYYEVHRDGVFLATVAGTESCYEEALDIAGEYTYRVFGMALTFAAIVIAALVGLAVGVLGFL